MWNLSWLQFSMNLLPEMLKLNVNLISLTNFDIPFLTPVLNIAESALLATPVVDKGIPVNTLNPQIEASIEGSFASAFARMLLRIPLTRSSFCPEHEQVPLSRHQVIGTITELQK